MPNNNNINKVLLHFAKKPREPRKIWHEVETYYNAEEKVGQGASWNGWYLIK